MRPAVGNESCSISASVATLGSTRTHETVPQIVWKHVVRNDLTNVCPDMMAIGTEQYNKSRIALNTRKHRLKKTIKLEPKPQPQLTEPPASILSPDSENIFPTSTSKVSQTKMNPNFIQTSTHGLSINEYDTDGTLT